ncbi:uncharacterized protein BJ171DRAFT_488605 [Polychytrium aggregatum]|uniref:uncharacterized protein n=1 Tax=Polychytrium aggregatum TaxID=110093 RepID=UPI0022FF2629|nr:uncharacterized protein BJ171DRAFT_488605 [Polychytrium aggregatum]KAI9209132.1 hypothetical protein BJ171DRAFT_488605 [Polychytrium aggregatum]
MREGSIPNLSALTGSTQAPVVVPVGAQPPGSAPVYVQAPVAASEYPQVPVAASEYPQAPAPISEYPQAPAPAPEYSQIPAPAPEYAQAQVPASEYPQAQVPAPVDAQAPGGPTIQVLTEVAPANGPTDRVQKGVDGLLRKDLTKTFGVSEKLSKVAHASNGCCGCGKITTGVAVISIIAVSTFNGVVTSGVASNKVQMASAGITYSSAGGNWCSQYQAVYAQSGYTLSSGCCNALMSDQNQLLSCDNSLSNIGSTDLAQNTNFANCVNQATSIIGNSGVNSNSLDVDLKYSGAVFQCYGLVGYSDCAAFGTVLYNGC